MNLMRIQCPQLIINYAPVIVDTHTDRQHSIVYQRTRRSRNKDDVGSAVSVSNIFIFR